jgi:phospholipase/carboxylesterase
MAKTEAELPVLDPPVVIETGSKPVGTVIWLHGLGADGHDFEPIVPEFNLPPSLPLRFVFPHAPYRGITWNKGYVMRAWYDILGVTAQGMMQNLTHVQESTRIIYSLIEQEYARGISSSRIVLAGFSQGGSVVLHAGLRYDRPLAGVLSLSAPSFDLDSLVQGVSPANRQTPLFIAHGDRDAVVPLTAGQQTRDFLLRHGLAPQWREYPMAHGVCEAEIADISQWLTGVLGS